MTHTITIPAVNTVTAMDTGGSVEVFTICAVVVGVAVLVTILSN